MWRILIGIAVVVAVLVAALWLSTNWIVGRAIERGATRGLGVESSVGFVRLRLLDGHLAMWAVRVGNPEGFDEPHFVSASSGEIEVDLGTVREPVVEIPLIAISGVDVVLEREGSQSNYGAILRGMGSFEKGGSAPASDEPEQRFVVRRLVIEDVSAHVEWSDVASEETRLALTIPQIELSNLGQEGGGLTTAELSSLIVKTLLGAIARQKGALPDAVVVGLELGLRGVAGIPAMVIRGAGDTLGAAAGEIVGDAVGDVVRELGDETADGLDAVGRGAGRALQGLLGGGSEDESSK